MQIIWGYLLSHDLFTSKDLGRPLVSLFISASSERFIALHLSVLPLTINIFCSIHKDHNFRMFVGEEERESETNQRRLSSYRRSWRFSSSVFRRIASQATRCMKRVYIRASISHKVIHPSLRSSITLFNLCGVCSLFYNEQNLGSDLYALLRAHFLITFARCSYGNRVNKSRIVLWIWGLKISKKISIFSERLCVWYEKMK